MENIKLPQPEDYDVSLYDAINKRYSCRNFMDKPLTLEQVASLLWAGQGIIKEGMFRSRKTVPSAGATYPLELFLTVKQGGVEDITPGVYHYMSGKHFLELTLEGDISRDLALACLRQNFIATASINIIIAAQYERTTSRYGKRGIRYTHMEAGNVTQNIHLQAVALGLGTVVIGAFDDIEVRQVLHLKDFEPLAIMPVGYST